MPGLRTHGYAPSRMVAPLSVTPRWSGMRSTTGWGVAGSISELFARSVDAIHEAWYELGMAFALTNASAAARDAGNAAEALDLAERAAAVSRRLSAFDVLTIAVQNQAQALVALGRADEAEAPLGEVLGHFTATSNVLRQAECLEVMGELYALRPDHDDTAARCFELASTLARRVGARTLAERLERRLAELGAGREGRGGAAGS